jgi:hypothetical protein
MASRGSVDQEGDKFLKLYPGQRSTCNQVQCCQEGPKIAQRSRTGPFLALHCFAAQKALRDSTLCGLSHFRPRFPWAEYYPPFPLSKMIAGPARKIGLLSFLLASMRQSVYWINLARGYATRRAATRCAGAMARASAPDKPRNTGDASS